MTNKGVYFIQAAETHRIKIGYSGDVKTRIKSLQTSEELNLIYVIENGTHELEKKLHNQFSKFRSHGEWFNPDDVLLDYIDETRFKNLNLNVYLAGKMNGNKNIFANTHNLHNMSRVISSDEMDNLEPKAWNHTPPKEYGLQFCESNYAVDNYVISPIDHCDMVLAYLDASDAYGTIAEIAYASGLGKHITVIIEDDIIDKDESTDAYWLVCCFPNVFIEFTSKINNLYRELMSNWAYQHGLYRLRYPFK